MFETPIDTLFLWIALGGVAVAVLGVVAGLPTTAPPNAAGTAATIDEVTTSPAGSVRRWSTTGDEWRLDGRRLGLRNDGGTTHARLSYPVVPAHGTGLRRVLAGQKPARVYASPAGFRDAIRHARTDGDTWRSAPDRLTVRHVAWEGVDVTLVG
jgi:hypothetical protein